MHSSSQMIFLLSQHALHKCGHRGGFLSIPAWVTRQLNAELLCDAVDLLNFEHNIAEIKSLLSLGPI